MGEGGKPALRKACWSALREAGAARFPGVEGRIPNFKGAEAAARHVSELAVFQAASCIKCNPDLPQRPVRHAALKAGKRVYLAVPRLREAACFIELDPDRLGPGRLWAASSIKGASALGRPLRPRELPRICMVLTGCVGAGLDGARLGKGGGYSDLEFALLLEAGRIRREVPVVTTVHSSQLLPSCTVPADPWDVSIDHVATERGLAPMEDRLPRPEGLIWSALPEDRLSSIPALVELRQEKG